MVVFECIDVKMLIPAWSRLHSLHVMARICFGAGSNDHHDGGMVVLVNVRGTLGPPYQRISLPAALAADRMDGSFTRIFLDLY